MKNLKHLLLLVLLVSAFTGINADTGLNIMKADVLNFSSLIIIKCLTRIFLKTLFPKSGKT